MSIHTELHDFRQKHPRKNALKVARLFVEEHDADDFIKLIAEEIERLDRVTNREIETRVMQTIADRSREATRASFPAEIRRLVYQVGDGTDKVFGRMTAAQHVARAQMLRKMSDGLVRSAKIHEEAAEAIEAAGVTCLDDIRESALPIAA